MTGSDLSDYSPVTIQNISGDDRLVLSQLGSFNLTVAASGQNITITSSVVWTNTSSNYLVPQIGDILHIPTGSAIAGAGNANLGWYTVTAVTSASVTATRLNNGAPVAVSITAGSSSPASFSVQRLSIPGVGKAMEIFNDSGAVSVATEFLNLNNTPVSFLSTIVTPVVLTSASESDVTMTVKRLSDNTNATLTPNNAVVLSVGYEGTSAALTVGFTGSNGTGLPQITTTVSGGIGANLTINPLALGLSTVQSLANFINSQTGYTASVPNTLFGQLPLVALNTSTGLYQWTLDQGTFGIDSTNGGQPGRIKNDAYAFFNSVMNGTGSVIITNITTNSNAAIPVQPTAGLPDPTSTFYVGSGFGSIPGATGGTSNANVSNALAACQGLTCNFVVSLFSQDATSDIPIGATDPASTYTINAINENVLTHVLFMSDILQKGNRQGFCSYRNSFVNDLSQSAMLANYRVSLTFQDQKVVDLNGNITQFQPWMGSVLAASMQAAGFYRSIMRKQMNTTGVLQNIQPGNTQPDFNPLNKSLLTQALEGGLLTATPSPTGGFYWVSDQTTYQVDNNFVYNSIQAVYAADLCALTLQQRLETLFVGQSLADVSASTVLTAVQSIMADLKRLKLIAASDGVPTGYNNVSVQIQGYTMQVSVNIYLANAIAFIPITVNVSQVTQSATSA